MWVESVEAGAAFGAVADSTAFPMPQIEGRE
jgi:hypothetical protein